MAEVVFGDEGWDVLEPPPPPPKFKSPSGSETPEKVCDVCGREFKSIGGMKRHRSQVHGIGTDDGAKSHPVTSGSKEVLRQQADAFSMFFYGLLGGLLAQVDPVCGAGLQACQQGAAEAWYQAALVNPTVAKIIRSTESVGVWGMLFGAHLPLIEAVRQHHLTPHPRPEEVEIPDDAVFAQSYENAADAATAG